MDEYKPAEFSANLENREATSAPEPNFVWTESERKPRAMPSDAGGHDGWWEQHSATRS